MNRPMSSSRSRSIICKAACPLAARPGIADRSAVPRTTAPRGEIRSRGNQILDSSDPAIHANASIRTQLGKLAGQAVCSVLPTFILTPTITGWARSNTDVFENFALQYGFPTLAPGLEKAAAMDPQVLREQRAQTQTCREAFQAIDWNHAYPKGVPELHELPDHHRHAVEAMLGSAYQLYQVADTNYKLSMGSYKASVVGKAAGGR